MKKLTNKGFTLVELIIVITILAILATIAFVSFQGYAGQARDSKKQAELTNLKDQISVKIAANSVVVTSFVSENATDTLSSVNYGGTTVNSGSTRKYIAGDVNYPVLGAASGSYKFGYKIGVIDTLGGLYQIATRLEDNTIYTAGNYSPRSTSMTASGETNSSKILTLTKGIGLFQVGDFIKNSDGSASGEITKISSDLSQLTLSGTTTTISGTGITLIGTADSEGYLENKYLVNTGSTILLK